MVQKRKFQMNEEAKYQATSQQ